MFGFLGSLIGMGAKLFSKIKPAIQGAVKLFNKGKNVYSAVKNTVSNVLTWNTQLFLSMYTCYHKDQIFVKIVHWTNSTVNNVTFNYHIRD
jgi:hypothetical protein